MISCNWLKAGERLHGFLDGQAVSLCGEKVCSQAEPVPPGFRTAKKNGATADHDDADDGVNCERCRRLNISRWANAFTFRST